MVETTVQLSKPHKKSRPQRRICLAFLSETEAQFIAPTSVPRSLSTPLPMKWLYAAWRKEMMGVFLNTGLFDSWNLGIPRIIKIEHWILHHIFCTNTLWNRMNIGLWSYFKSRGWSSKYTCVMGHVETCWNLRSCMVFKIFQVATITLFVGKNTKIQRLTTNFNRLNFPPGCVSPIVSTPKEMETPNLHGFSTI